MLTGFLISGFTSREATYISLTQKDAPQQRSFPYELLITTMCAAIPLFLCCTIPGRLGASTALLALTVGAGSIIGKSTAQKQRDEFEKNNNRTMVCQEGLWQYSRHPDAFFGWTFWWSTVLLAWGSPSRMAISAVPLSLSILFSHDEKATLNAKGEAFRIYQQTTNEFFPWFPSRKSSPADKSN